MILSSIAAVIVAGLFGILPFALFLGGGIMPIRENKTLAPKPAALAGQPLIEPATPNSHLGRNVVIAIVIIALAVIGAGAFIFVLGSNNSSHTSLPTATQTGAPSVVSSSLTSQTTTSRASSTSSSTSSSTTSSITSGPYSLRITQAALDATHPPQVSYILTVDATYSGTKQWNFNPLSFQLVTNDSHIYDATLTFSTVNPPGAVTLSPDQQASGQIAFEISPNEAPAQLEYNDSFTPVDLELTVPAVSSWVSYFEPTAVSVGPASFANYVDSYALVQGSRPYYYTGAQRPT